MRPVPSDLKAEVDLRGDWGPENIWVNDLPVNEGDSCGRVGELGEMLGELESPGREEMEYNEAERARPGMGWGALDDMVQ
jgi:hypothetical protein